MICYRISKKKYAKDLSGTGAKLYGGRWNSEGLPALYTSRSLSLAILEQLVRVPVHILNLTFIYIEIEIPDDSLKQLTPKMLPKNWRKNPISKSTQRIGDQWLKDAKHLCFEVPSAINPVEKNIIINPFHKDFSKVKITKTGKLGLSERVPSIQ